MAIERRLPHPEEPRVAGVLKAEGTLIRFLSFVLVLLDLGMRARTLLLHPIAPLPRATARALTTRPLDASIAT
jgi:hypothetical protein